jgi:hypothetical protein
MRFIIGFAPILISRVVDLRKHEFLRSELGDQTALSRPNGKTLPYSSVKVC